MHARHETEPGVRFDRDKFCDAVHFVIDQCANDLDQLGKTKLHKCLYYADMLSYIDRGESVTGVEYVKEPFGPFARYLNWALRELENAGKIAVSKRNFFGLEKYDFESRSQPHTNTLSEDEKKLLAVVIEYVCGRSTKEISEISDTAPWKSVGMGERIPYASAFLLLPARRPTQRELEIADERRMLARDALA